MVRSVASERCELARQRLTHRFLLKGDVYDELPQLLEDIAQRFAEEATTFRTLVNGMFTLDTPKLEAAAAKAAEDYSSYFNAFVYMSRNQHNHRDRYRHLSGRIMELTYPLLACQEFTPIGLDAIILDRWHHILINPS